MAAITPDGSRIRALREESGRKRPEFAEEVRISYSHMANIEKGHSLASPEVMARIARALHVSLAEVIAPRQKDVA